MHDRVLHMLKVQSLACRRGKRFVFRDIDFNLEAGDLLLVTGANGSGKSSLLRLLAGLLAPAQGSLFWQGEPIREWADHRTRLHFLGHSDALKPELTTSEMLSFWRALRGLKQKDQSVLQFFALDHLHNVPVRHLSAGQKRRLALTRLIVDDAPLWLLDEPATALDSGGQARLLALIARHRAQGGVAVIATHQALPVLDAQTLQLGAVA